MEHSVLNYPSRKIAGLPRSCWAVLYRNSIVHFTMVKRTVVVWRVLEVRSVASGSNGTVRVNMMIAPAIWDTCYAGPGRCVPILIGSMWFKRVGNKKQRSGKMNAAFC